MDEQQSQRQIQQMVNFILNEAKDKADEIDAKTLEEFNIEKLKYVQGQKAKIRAELETKKKKQETEIAIARSTAINRSRMQKSEAMHQCMHKLKQECEKEIKNVIADRTKYANLCADLIVQGCLKLVEPSVTVKCRKEDEATVKQSLDIASRKYSEVLKRATGASISLSLSVAGSYLPSSCGGGVVLTAAGNSISIDNTLNTRMGLTMDNDVPSLRRMVFGGR